MQDDYKPTPDEYLRRAKARLAEERVESLFYAAFEIRCAVEARLQEYLEPQKHVNPREKNQWNAGKLAASVTRAFRVDKVARVIITDRTTGEVFGTFFYTPVTPELQNLAERLGNYLHALRQYRLQSDPWWLTLRSELRRGIELLDEAMMGELLGPPTREPDSNFINMPLRYGPDTGDPRTWPSVEINFDIAYFDSLADARATLPNKALQQPAQTR